MYKLTPILIFFWLLTSCKPEIVNPDNFAEKIPTTVDSSFVVRLYRDSTCTIPHPPVYEDTTCVFDENGTHIKDSISWPRGFPQYLTFHSWPNTFYMVKEYKNGNLRNDTGLVLSKDSTIIWSRDSLEHLSNGVIIVHPKDTIEYIANWLYENCAFYDIKDVFMVSLFDFRYKKQFIGNTDIDYFIRAKDSEFIEDIGTITIRNEYYTTITDNLGKLPLGYDSCFYLGDSRTQKLKVIHDSMLTSSSILFNWDSLPDADTNSVRIKGYNSRYPSYSK